MIDVKLQDAVHDDRLLLDSLETANALRISRRHLLNLAKNRRFLAPLKLGNDHENFSPLGDALVAVHRMCQSK